MNKRAFLSLLVLLCVVLRVPAQTDQDDVVRITTNLVLVDAVVTKNGKPVADLKAEDFEIFEDGKKQTITSFAYISNVPTTSAAPPAPTTKEKTAVPVPFTPLKRNEPRRTIAIVVDDLGLSAESMSSARKQLRKFVNEQIQPNDLVAIIRTGTERGALQQFTNDKRLLNSAVDRLKWNICSRAGVSVIPIRPPEIFQDLGRQGGCVAIAYSSTMTALRYILDALAELPGRKSMVVLTDSMPIEDQEPNLGPGAASLPFDDRMNRLAALRRIAEKAIRSSVVIYSIDVQGLQPIGPTAADSFSGNVRQMTQQMNDLMNSRARLLHERRAGGDLISKQTGGFQVKNSNDLRLDRVLQDQSGYYLIGYRPTDETFNRRFHRITAKVKRGGMTLRTRHGFYGFSEDETVRKPRSKTNLALASPFAVQDIPFDFSAFYFNGRDGSQVVRSFLYLSPKDLTFTTKGQQHEAEIELHGVIFGDSGVAVAEVKHGAVAALSDKDYQQALRDGLSLSFDMPVKRAGAYQVRVAARDVKSSLVGSAGQFIAVPDLKNKKLALSGIVLRRLVGPAAEGETAPPLLASPAVKRFPPGSEVHFACIIYNAAIDVASGRPNLVMEGALFRDGKRIYTAPEAVIDVANQTDLARVFAHGVLQLNPDLEPGYYYLQIAITDRASRDKQPTTVQWIDFEIAK